MLGVALDVWPHCTLSHEAETDEVYYSSPLYSIWDPTLWIGATQT